MPDASATAAVSFPPLADRRPAPATAVAGSTFADGLAFAYDLAYRAPGSLSLAQRDAYGLRIATHSTRSDLGRRAQLDSAVPDDVADVARRAQLGADALSNDAPRGCIPDVARRAQLGDSRPDTRPHHARPRHARPHDARPNDARPNVERRARLGDSPRLRHPYFRFDASVAGVEMCFIVVSGRVFAGTRSWTR